MIISFRVNKKGIILKKIISNVDYIDVGKNGLHAFKGKWNHFIPFSDIQSVRIEHEQS